MIDFSDIELDALRSDVVSKGVFFRMSTDPVIRLWLGFGDIKPGKNILDTDDGTTYFGFGEINNIPVFRSLLNGAAERVSFQLNGVSGKVFDLAANDTDQVIGKAINVGFMLFKSDWTPLGPIHWHANYVAGPLSFERQHSTDPTQPVVCNISLSAGSTFTSRRRPGNSYWTDPDQQNRFPNDAFCSRAGAYTREYELAWPTYH